MLRDLYVRDLAVVAEAAIEFAPGLNVLTGETGAGKSIVVDALMLLRGARANSELLRSGRDRLVVSGRFDLDSVAAEVLEEAGLDAEDELVVRREVEREGRNRVFINDQPVTLKLLRRATGSVLQIHAQREELDLATPEAQRTFVDAVGGADAERLVSRTRKAHEVYAGLAARLESVRGDRRSRDERVDLLRFQLAEIAGARLEEGEDEMLALERDQLRNSEQIAAALGAGHERLVEQDDAIVGALARIESDLRAIADWEPEARVWSEELTSARIGLSELADDLRRRLDGVSADPRRLDQVEARLDVIDRLCRKYGDSVARVQTFATERERELRQLEGDLEDSAALEEDVAAALGAYAEAAGELSAKRRRWAAELVAAAEAQFADLALDRAKLSVELAHDPLGESPLIVAGRALQFGPRGYDRVELYLAANPGEAPRPLAHCASGGELSRIYLALRLAVQRPGQTATTMVFDEADAGLGGEAASALGRKLRRLGRGSQVLAVTHLPQVASFADRHLGVRKRVSGGRTLTTVDLLAAEERIDEVARMLAGDQKSEVSRSHAEELITSAHGDSA